MIQMRLRQTGDCKQQAERCDHCLHDPLSIRAAIGSATSGLGSFSGSSFAREVS